MATPTQSNKVEFTFSAGYKSKDGTWKQIEAKREFDPSEVKSDKPGFARGKISVNVTEDDGTTTRTVEREIEFPYITSVSEMFDLLNTNPWLVISGWNYGTNLFARQVLKSPIAVEEEGPGRQIAKAAQELFDRRQKMGRPLSMERALELAREMWAAE